MLSHKKFYFFIFLLSIFFSDAIAQLISDDYVVVKDLKEEWIIYDYGEGKYYPYVLNTPFYEKTTNFSINLNDYKPHYLLMKIQGNTTLLFDQKVYRYYASDGIYLLKIDSLSKTINKGEVLISLFNPDFNINLVETAITSGNRAKAVTKVEKGVQVLKRAESQFSNFFIIAFLIIISLYAVLSNAFHKSFREFYSLEKIFSFKPKDNSAVPYKAFTAVNIPFIITYSFLVTLTFIILQYYLNDIGQLPVSFRFDSFFSPLFKWLWFAVLFFASMIVKYFIIVFFGFMFNLRNFSNLHFYDFIRISKLFYLTLFGVLSVMILGFNPDLISMKFAIYFLIIFSVFRVILLYLKLLRFAPYKNLHLFSYLCSTEVLPLLIGIRILLNN